MENKKLLTEISRIREIMSLPLNEDTLSSPLDGPLHVTSPYGEKRSYEIHPGVDLRAQTPQNIKSPLDGKILTANMNHNRLCGGTVDIQHPDGFWSRFCHCSQIFVKPGDVVKKGDVVAKSGGDRNDPGRGNSKNRHLHWTLKKNGQQVNPMHYIGASASSLGLPSSLPSSASDNKTVDNKIKDVKSELEALGLDKLKKGGNIFDLFDITNPNLEDTLKNLGTKIFPFLKEANERSYPNIDLSNIPAGRKNIVAPKKGTVTIEGKSLTLTFKENGETYKIQYCCLLDENNFVKITNGATVNKGAPLINYTDQTIRVSMFDKFNRNITQTQQTQQTQQTKKEPVRMGVDLLPKPEGHKNAQNILPTPPSNKQKNVDLLPKPEGHKNAQNILPTPPSNKQKNVDLLSRKNPT